MSWSFDIPPAFVEMWHNGELVRRGALLLHRDGGTIAAHLQETGAASRLLRLAANPAQAVLESILRPVTAASSHYGNFQNAKTHSLLREAHVKLDQSLDLARTMDGKLDQSLDLARTMDGKLDQSLDLARTMDGKLDGMQSALGQIAGMQVASLAVSLAGIGVTAVAAGLMLRRIAALGDEVRGLGQRIDSLGDRLSAEWRNERINDLLDGIDTARRRLDEARSRRDPRPLLEKADERLAEGFDAFANRLGRFQSMKVVPFEDLAVLARGLAVSGATRVRVLMLLDEPESAAHAAQDQASRVAALLRAMPLNRLTATRAEEPRTDPARLAADAQALAQGLLETGRRAASIPPLLATLKAQGIAPRDWLRLADEAEAPALFLPGPAAPGRR